MLAIGSILPTFALDQMGRRKTMLTGWAGLGFCMLMVSALLSQAEKGGCGHRFATASVAFFFLHMLIYGAT